MVAYSRLSMLLLGALFQIGLLLVNQNEAAQIINLEFTDTITLGKLHRMLKKNLGVDDTSRAEEVAKQLAKTIDKHQVDTFAGKYSVYDLLHLNNYDEKNLKYCSAGEIEARLEVCQELVNDNQDNLNHYCVYCASRYFDICNRHKGDILTGIVHRNVSKLQYKKLSEFSQKFDAFIRREGDEDQSEEENMKEFLIGEDKARNLGNLIETTCKNILEEFDTILYFDENAKMTIDYLSTLLDIKEAKILARCKPYLDVVVELESNPETAYDRPRDFKKKNNSSSPNLLKNLMQKFHKN